MSDHPIDRLHAAVEVVARRLHVLHQARLHCQKGCSGCCLDDLTVFEVEAEPIRRHFPALLESGHPHARGACAFLDETGGCRIYASRPQVCRTQGLPLRWISDEDASVEHRDICPLNEAGPPIEELPALSCYTIGPHEDALARLEIARGAPSAERVELRSLFREQLASHLDE